MSPQGKSKSKSARSASADRSSGKHKKRGQSTAPLWIAGFLLAAIAIAMGYTIHKQGQAPRPESTAPQAAPEPGAPQGADPGAPTTTPGASSPGQSHGSSAGQSQSGSSSQILTN